MSRESDLNDVYSVGILFQEKLFKPYFGLYKDLTPYEALCLSIIRDTNYCTVMDLAKQLVVTKQYASLLAKSLIKKGYVDRQSSEKDRRAFVLTLTPTGSSHLSDHLEKMDAHYLDQLQKFDKKELSKVKESFSVLKAFLEKL